MTPATGQVRPARVHPGRHANVPVARRALVCLLLPPAVACGDGKRGSAEALEVLQHQDRELRAREQALSEKAVDLERKVRKIPEPLDDGCTPPRAVMPADRYFHHRNEGIESHGCLRGVQRVAALQDKPRVCTGEVCRYLGHLSYLLVNPDGSNANFLVYASVQDDALFDSSARLWSLTGVRIDTVSGTLGYHLAPEAGEREFRFVDAPVIIVFDYTTADRDAEDCPD